MTVTHKANSEILKIRLSSILDIILFVLILAGIAFRFSWVNWSQGTNLHPDEYGLTNTLTQLSVPKNLGEYFNTRISPISPYQKYDELGNATIQGPDNRMRWGQWPIIMIRTLGEWTGNQGYNEIRLLGRSLSALADTLSLILLFFCGKRLYGRRVGLLAAALSSLAVMQIQQSHFMTVDNFGVFFTMLALYATIRIAQVPSLIRVNANYRFNKQAIPWYLLFGVSMGMAVACKVNLVPVGGILLIAWFISIADLRLKDRNDLLHIPLHSGFLLLIAVLAAAITFRITQPMSFRATSGDTSIFTLHLNSDWVDSMQVASQESSGVGGGPPGEQWANRLAIIFPLANMVFWGMGLPLGITAWCGVFYAAWQSFKERLWRSHLIPVVWTACYFLFMGTRWVKSIRYFLPIYPFLCLLAAWFLVDWWQRVWTKIEGSPRKKWGSLVAPALVSLVVIGGTTIWAIGFVNAIYLHDNTRIQATEWIFQNIPAPFNITLKSGDQNINIPMIAPDELILDGSQPAYVQPFTPAESGNLTQITISHLLIPETTTLPGALLLTISQDLEGKQALAQGHMDLSTTPVAVRSPELIIQIPTVEVQANTTYYLSVAYEGQGTVQVLRSVLGNDNWDEGLPFPFNNYDPFGMFYRGVTMEVRWYDDENKRQMFLDRLEQVDYLIMPSQRAIWSADRIPLTYPMTMEYYRALFDGRLGFEKAVLFEAPIQIGPLYVSDLGGRIGWGEAPELPLFNYSQIAAEEAFTVYDHPPVWIFKKSADFDIEKVRQVLYSIDLSTVIIQSSRDATPLYGN